MKDTSVLNLVGRYQSYGKKVSEGHLGKTAAFWMSLITHCHLVFMLLYSVKTNNFEMFYRCNGKMASLFFALDGHNYSRYVITMGLVYGLIRAQCQFFFTLLRYLK